MMRIAPAPPNSERLRVGGPDTSFSTSFGNESAAHRCSLKEPCLTSLVLRPHRHPRPVDIHRKRNTKLIDTDHNVDESTESRQLHILKLNPVRESCLSLQDAASSYIKSASLWRFSGNTRKIQCAVRTSCLQQTAPSAPHGGR